MKALMTFPVKLLLAAELCAAKDDVRYYLNGVCIDDRYVVATNGHLLIAIPHREEVETGLPIIIPIEAVSNLRKMLGMKERNRGDVTLIQLENNEYRLQVSDKVIVFKAIDGKFPSWEGLRPRKNAEEELQGCFHWEYMSNFAKANGILSGIRDGYKNTEQIIQHGLQAAEVRLSAEPDAICILMPKRGGGVEPTGDILSEAQAAIDKDRSTLAELSFALEEAADAIDYLAPEEFDDPALLRVFCKAQTDRRDLIAEVRK